MSLGYIYKFFGFSILYIILNLPLSILFSISFSSSSPSGIPMIQMLEHLKLFQSFLSLSSFFWILVYSFCSGWMFISSFLSKWLIWVLVSFLSLLIPCIFCFISLCISFTYPSILQPYSTISVSILITSLLNSASDWLVISLLLSSIFGALICSFTWWFFCFGPCVMF